LLPSTYVNDSSPPAPSFSRKTPLNFLSSDELLEDSFASPEKQGLNPAPLD
jgi:hypothetical protein